MPAPTVDQQFVKAVKLSVLANRRWVPLPNKGFLHIKPLLMENGPVLSVKPAPEFTLLIYATSMGNHFKDFIGRHLIQLNHIFHFSDGNGRGRLEPINLVVENEIHGAVRGGAGSVNAIGNGFFDVLYLLDCVHKKNMLKRLLLLTSL